MKFLIRGSFGTKPDRDQKFSISVEAKSEKHALELAHTKLGSKHGASKVRITIDSIEKQNK